MSDRYLLRDSLGRGGMGEVFLADDTQLGRTVAVKFLSPELEQDETARQRLHREARSAAGLDHPFICKIHEIAEVDGRTGIVMEHVSGETLQVRLQGARPEPADALRIAEEVAEALAEAHRRQLIHRDLKPANVMLTTQGHVKVMDFGLAKPAGQPSSDPEDAETVAALTEVGVRVGTPGYMAPEQILGGAVDERSDIFAFGILLYELLAGVHPFTRSSPSETMSAIVKESPASVTQHAEHAPLSVVVLLERLLAKEPSDRYQSFTDVRTDLARLVQETSSQTPIPGGTAISQTATAGGSEATLYRTPLVGRDAEAGELRGLLDQAAGGAGALVSLAGEPGVGKTRLSTELATEGRARGFLTLVGHCYEGEGTRSFLPWIEILETTARITARDTLRALLADGAPEIAKLLPALRRLFPDLPPPLDLDPESERNHLFACFAEFVERSSRLQPLLLVLEDLHWSDEPTLLLLRHLTQRLAQMPVLVVATYRDVELDVARPLAAALRQLVRDRLVTRIVLRRLDQADVGRMVEALSRREPPPTLISAIFNETEGNPFFVEEVYEHLAEEGRLFDTDGAWREDLTLDTLDVPEGVRLVVGRRLERLSDEHRGVLTVAAVLGRRFAYSLLETASDLDPDGLLDGIETAEQLHLVEPDGASAAREPQYRFAHELIRQTLLTELSMPRRQRLHARVAAAIEEHYATDIDRHAPALAHHLYEAGARVDEERTVQMLMLAADQALESGGFEEALGAADRALSVEPEAPHVIAALRWTRGLAGRSLGAWDQATADWSQALERFEQTGDSAAVARTCRELAHLYCWLAQPSEAEAAARRGLDALAAGAHADRSRLLGYLAWALSIGQQFEAADTTARQAVSIAEEHGDSRLHGEMLLALHWPLYHTMRRREQVEVLGRAVELLRPTRDLARLGEAQANLQGGLTLVGRLDDAARPAAETQAIGERLGRLDVQLMGGISEWQRRWLENADPDVQDSDLRGLVKTIDAMGGGWAFVSAACLANASLTRGRLDEMHAHARAAFDMEPTGKAHMGQAWGSLFLSECLLGHRETALELLSDPHAVLPREGTLNGIGAWEALIKMVEGFTVIGELERAAALYPLTVEAIATGALVNFEVSHLLQTVAGIAAAAGRQWPAAETHYQTALRQADDIPFVSEQAEARRWYASMLIDRDAPGDRDKARTLLGEAVETYRTIGMPKHLEIAESMLHGS